MSPLEKGRGKSAGLAPVRGWYVARATTYTNGFAAPVRSNVIYTAPAVAGLVRARGCGLVNSVDAVFQLVCSCDRMAAGLCNENVRLVYTKFIHYISFHPDIPTSICM